MVSSSYLLIVSFVLRNWGRRLGKVKLYLVLALRTTPYRRMGVGGLSPCMPS